MGLFARLPQGICDIGTPEYREIYIVCSRKPDTKVLRFGINSGLENVIDLNFHIRGKGYLLLPVAICFHIRKVVTGLGVKMPFWSMFVKIDLCKKILFVNQTPFLYKNLTFYRSIFNDLEKKLSITEID